VSLRHYGQSFETGGIQAFLRARIERQLAVRAGERVNPMPLVQVNAYLGNRDEAVRWLAEAVEQRLPIALFTSMLPMYDPLRGHPKFEELVRKMGFE
jgi:hypothetical protein